MTNYIFSVTRLGEKETHKLKASSEDDAWKSLVLKVDMTNVDKIVLVTIG
jgi:hypothetical protein